MNFIVTFFKDEQPIDATLIAHSLTRAKERAKTYQSYGANRAEIQESDSKHLLAHYAQITTPAN